jgi:hypothetical protein
MTLGKADKVGGDTVNWLMLLLGSGIVIGLAGSDARAREPAAWESLLKGGGTEGWTSGGPSFKRDGQAIIASDGGSGDRLMTGEASWTDYEFAADVTPVKGPLIQLHYRISDGGKRWYTLDLRPEARTVTISAADLREGRNSFGPLITRSMETVYGTEYSLRVVVRGSQATAYVNDVEVGTLREVKAPAGAVGLGLFASRAVFRNPRIRHIK